MKLAILALTLSAAATAQTAANAFLDDTTVQVLNVTMASSDWAALQQNYLLDTYYHANLTWNGMSTSFGIRSHGGNGSRSAVKPNLDFNFAHYIKSQLFLGLPFVLLKANNEDPSNLHEWISMKLYRRMGLPAPREAPAQLYINGQLLGFYYIVEHEDLNFVERDFGENGGYLYEWEYGAPPYNWSNLGTDPTAYSTYLGLKSNQSSADLQTFSNFIQAVNQTGVPESSYIATLSQYMDPKLFLSYCATDLFLADADGILDGVVGTNNFYLYQFQGTTLYQMIAWDKDRTFNDPNLIITDGITSGTNIDTLAQALYAFADYRNVYLSELTRAGTLFGSTGGWADSEITREYSVIRAAALNDPNKQCDYLGVSPFTPVPCGTLDFESGVEQIHSFIAQRASVVFSSALTAGYQPIAANPQIQSAQGVGTSGASPEQLSPGALTDIAGMNFGPTAQATGIPMPRILGTTFVAVEGVRAPLFLSSSGAIEFQMPGDLATGISNVVVSVGGAMSNTLSVDTWTTSPVLLAVTRANGSVVAPGNAPTAGEYITLYALGLGAVTPDVPIGGTTSGSSFATTIVMPQITLGNAALKVVFSGLVPGYVGLYQINAQMPIALPQGGSAPLILAADGEVISTEISLQ